MSVSAVSYSFVHPQIHAAALVARFQPPHADVAIISSDLIVQN